jgi:hypothetical protein
MKINLITPEQHAELLQIQKEFPILTLQNKGYQYIDKSKLTDQDKEKIKEIETILKASISGFSSFTNFRHDNNGELQIRFQYNYDYGTKGYFIGVGYILVDELLNGFKN